MMNEAEYFSDEIDVLEKAIKNLQAMSNNTPEWILIEHISSMCSSHEAERVWLENLLTKREREET